MSRFAQRTQRVAKDARLAGGNWVKNRVFAVILGLTRGGQSSKDVPGSFAASSLVVNTQDTKHSKGGLGFR